MKDDRRIKRVRFAEQKLFQAFQELKTGTTEDQLLVKRLEEAIENLKINPFCGIKIPSRLWPKEYVNTYRVTNLWKYDLPHAWRLIYTITGNEIEIISIILEWFDHKQYEKKFKHKVR